MSCHRFFVSHKAFIFVGMKPYRFRFTWSHLFAASLLALLGFLLSRCTDQDPPPPSVVGVWQQRLPATPGWTFSFADDGILTQYHDSFGATLSWMQFNYHLSGDILYISGDANNLPRVWRVELLTSADMKVREMPQDTAARAWKLLYFEKP